MLQILEVHHDRIAVVSPDQFLCHLAHDPENPDSTDLVLDFVVRAQIWPEQTDAGETLVMKQISEVGRLVVDGKTIPHGNQIELPNGSVIDVQHNSMYVDTHGTLGRWLTGMTANIAELEREVKANPYGHVSNAMSVWNDTAVSPDCLGPVGREVYNLIVQHTGRAYRDRVEM